MWVTMSDEQFQAQLGPYNMIYYDCDYGDNCNFNT